MVTHPSSLSAPGAGRTVLVALLDNAGDVLLQGPLVRAVAARADRVVFLASPQGTAAAELLPGVDEVWTWHCPWILGDPPPVDAAVISTSFHQSPLPLALLLRATGVQHDVAGFVRDGR